MSFGCQISGIQDKINDVWAASKRKPSQRWPQKEVEGQLKEIPDFFSIDTQNFFFSIDTQNFEVLAGEQDSWSSICQRGAEHFEAARNKDQIQRRIRRHEAAQRPNNVRDPQHRCPECGKLCGSRIGLFGHRRTHQRRQWLGALVIIGNDGLP